MGEVNVLAGIASLIDTSLLFQTPQRDETSRFRMLETIRTFALEHLAANGEESVVRQAHAAHYLVVTEQLSDQLFASTNPTLLDVLDREHDNVRAALVWLDRIGDAETCLRLATACGWLWFVRGYFREGRGWLDRARPPTRDFRRPCAVVP